ncbi:glycosyltransferase [Cryobacterium ruanii]|uniref:glycosyltransferase n=1 Tax=Cryobacterium ruanii TaxID=1259197 RepID=UPI001F541A3B|nr:glycosyltransferase [Cryobacterium ruanii]
MSVIIVNFRGAADTLECVRTLIGVDWPADRLEIIVVENGSGDDSENSIRAAMTEMPSVQLIVSDENLGFTGGSNLGASHAKGEFVAFLNNDAKPDAGWIRGAIKQFEISPQVAAVGSKVLNWEGTHVDFVGGSVTWFGMGYKDHVTELDDVRFDRPRDILFGTGSALFVRGEVFRSVGGFDERMFMFYDDVDLGWRLNLLGYRVRYAPASKVFHKHHGSMKSFGQYREMYLLERNALFMLYKNLSAESLATFLPAALALSARRSIAKSGLDSESFDIRRFTGSSDEFDPTMEVDKEAIAGFFAIDQFVANLPNLEIDRVNLQSRRTKTDSELFRLFGDMFTPLFDAAHFTDGLERIVSSFHIDSLKERRRILVVTGDSLGQKMAGPAMRAWKISEALSTENDVRLVTWNVASRSSDLFEVSRVRLGNERDMKVHEGWADVIVFQGHALHHFKTLLDSDKIIVADLYDPMHLEQLEQGREFGTESWVAQVRGANDVLNQQLERGDFFLCASDRQRMFWLGQLTALGRVNPHTYSADENLEGLIAIAPFGMDAQSPVHTREAIRGVVPGIGKDDKVVIWGGGIYNWFDTLTLIRAIGRVAETHPDVRLFFLGVAHPNPDVPEMEIVSKTRDLVEQLGLAGKNVFFNEQWVALDDRQNYLLEADAGVSTHYAHIETTFSFRTRILDYMWAELPIVTTNGDGFGDLVERTGMGISVPERNVEALADALIKVLYDDEIKRNAHAAVLEVREQFTWAEALRPLIEFCRDPQIAPDRATRLAGQRVERVRSVRKSALTRSTPEGRLHEAATTSTGLAREVALIRYYVTEGGVTMLASKAKSRVVSVLGGKATT